uniref:UBP-type domain-containing protein n=1 Tax=Steinernema glaseri TaxID=37863 RepID=A0A1I7ZDN0_9BILA
MTAPETVSELVAEKQCVHRHKKSLFSSTSVKRTLIQKGKKKPKPQKCDGCAREQEKAGEEAKPVDERTLFICAQDGCGKYVCGCRLDDHADCHMHQHATNTNPHHMIFYDFKALKLWCEHCKVELLPNEDGPVDLVKQFLDAMPKPKTEEEKKQEDIVNGNAEPVVEIDPNNKKRTRNTGTNNGHVSNGVLDRKKQGSVAEETSKEGTVDNTGLPHIKVGLSI